MLEEHNKRDKTHIIDLVSKRSGNTPSFALLIGAGASASSGVKTASEMIAEWRRQLYRESKSEDKFAEWLPKQDWYEDEEEYSILFEKVCDQRSQRRIYIEKCVENARSSWGYIYLANIIAHNFFNIIFTPNFDDLANEACFLYADLRPIVCAHDSAVVDIRVTSARPKIIKLHGDFLYDSIKNTIKETENLENNMRDKFLQFATEYGLIVLGYGGNDRSIMDTLDKLLMSERYCPNGLYWCRRKEDKVSKKLQRLMRRENAYWLEIDGFDEFMAELHEGLGIALPNAIHDPYKATTERLNKFISIIKEVKHPIIKEDITELEEQVKRFEEVISGKSLSEEFDRLVPYRFLGDTEYMRNNYESALIYYQKELLKNPNNIDVMSRIVWSYIWTEQFEEALKMSERMVKQSPDYFYSYWMRARSLKYLNRLEDALSSYGEALKYTTEKTQSKDSLFLGRSNVHLIAGNWEEGLRDAEKALQIVPEDHVAILNKAIALKKLGTLDEANKILQDVLPKIESKYVRACAFAVLGNKNNMLEELQAAIKEERRYKVDAKFDPDFADYKVDPDFRKLVYESVEKVDR